MASSRGGERVVHQDYIARIRYSNALPPPSNPPKLLDIPNAGLASSHYVTSGFGARLAREQALNIEADAELGMPIDLVGMPGVFDGDERAIQAPPAGTVKLHPKDEALTRPLGSLGKPKVADGGVSFLRRTEYTASSTNKRPVNPFMPSANNRQRQLKRPSPEPDRDSPAYIKKKIESGFVAAKKMREGQVKHPTKRHLKLVSSMPVLPDLETFPDAGAYVSLKFATNPLPKSSTYDTRMMSGLLRPQEQSQIEADAYAAACEEWEANGQKGPKPVAPTAYDFYLADSATAAANFRKKLDLGNQDRHDESLYTSRSGSQGSAVFSYKHLRAYETAKETEMDHSTKYSDELLLTLQEGPDGHTVAYYLPVMARTTIQNQRSKNIARTVGMIEEEEGHVDQLDIRIEDPLPEIMERINFFKADPENTPPDNQDPDQSQDDGANGDAVGESDLDADGEETADQTMVAPRDFDDEEEDAEGEEEEDD